MASLLHLGVAALRASLGPCDIFAADGYPCVAAHSMVRALLGTYDGALYTVNRSSDLTVQDIGVVAAGGRADAAAQDKFCAGTDCFVQRIYDQVRVRGESCSLSALLHCALSVPPAGACVCTVKAALRAALFLPSTTITSLSFHPSHAQSGRDNHLDIGPPGGFVKHGDQPVNATGHPIVVSGGHTVYAALFEGGMGYRNDKTSGVAVGNDPETLYMVTSGKIYNGGCCFDYGAWAGRRGKRAARRRRRKRAARHRAFCPTRYPHPPMYVAGNAEVDNSGGCCARARPCLRAHSGCTLPPPAPRTTHSTWHTSQHADDGLATMEAIYFGSSNTTGRGAGAGPWVRDTPPATWGLERREGVARTAAPPLVARGSDDPAPHYQRRHRPFSHR